MKSRTPYEKEKEFLLLEDGCGGEDRIVQIGDEFIERGLRGIRVRINNSSQKDFEYIEVYTINNTEHGWVLGDEDNPKTNYCSNRYFVSIYKPEFIVDAIDNDITQYEKDILYEFTSSHWEEIINTFKSLYYNPYFKNCVEEYNPNKKVDEIVWPDKSPDYRLLPDCKK